MGKSTISMVIFNSYVKLPESNQMARHDGDLIVFEALILMMLLKFDH